jgi:molybdenum cofactor synthesis domain-containing protein
VENKVIQALIMSIGNELLSGQTINTNASFLAKELTRLGFNVLKIITIPDMENEVVPELKKAISDNKFRVIITTGGLGPTWDDSTSKFLAKALDVPLILNNKALAIVKRRYSELYNEGLVKTTKITSAREKMAYLPEGTTPIDNPVGTAPGIQFKTKEGYTLILCFPGVPKEMKAMFQESISELVSLKEEEDVHYYETEVITPFTDESLLAPLLKEIRKKFDVWIKSLPNTYQEEKNIRLVISSYGKSAEDVKTLVLKAQEYLHSLFPEK